MPSDTAPVSITTNTINGVILHTSNKWDNRLKSPNKLNTTTNEKLDASHNTLSAEVANNNNSLNAHQDDLFKQRIPAAITDTNASANCSQAATISSCGRYSVAADPFITTGKKSNKVFAMAMDHCIPAGKIKLLRHKIHKPAQDVPTVQGIKHNLLSINKFA